MEESAKQQHKKWRWVILGTLLLALLGAGLISYFTWWPLSVEAAYQWQLETGALVLTIEDGQEQQETLRFSQQLKEGFLLAARARRAFHETKIAWSSSDPAVASVDESGVVTARGKGQALIEGRWGGLQLQCPVQVFYPLKGIVFSEDELILNKKEEALLQVLPSPIEADMEGQAVFSSENPRVATVDEMGRVLARSVGSTRLIARLGDWEAICPITVLSPMSRLVLNTRDHQLNRGKTLQLRVQVYPKDSTDPRDFLWESENPAVASVDEAGLVQALAPGETTIRVRAGEISDSMHLQVLAPLEGIELETEQLRLLRDESVPLLWLPQPADTTDEIRPRFQSLQPEIVSVDETGMVTALGPGEGEVEVRVGTFVVRCQVIVRVPMEAFEIEGGGTMVRGSEAELRTAFYPEDTNDDRSVRWESSDESVVTVDEKGHVRAVGAGSGVVSAYCGDFISRVSVDVIVPVSGVAIEPAALKLIRGEGADISARVLPEDTTEDRHIYFSSSNPQVATVDGEGRVYAAGPGSCLIYASHGDFSAACQLEVRVPMTGIALSRTQLGLIEGEGSSLTLSYEPWDTTDSRGVNWTSSNPAVAAVDGQGNIWASGAGDCIISAQVGDFTASAQLHVEPFIHVEWIGLSESEIYFSAYGESRSVTAWVGPDNVTNPAVSWQSSNPAVATVDAGGTVRAVGSGQAVITATAENQSASLTVTANLPTPPKVVVLDPGHGGIFNGAVFEGRLEKNLNLTTAYACKNYLETHYSNVVVYLTRSGDETTSGNLREDLFNRAAMAAHVGADFLLSLHYNASVYHNASGTVVYASIDPRVGDASYRMAHVLVNRLASLGLTNLGVGSRFNDDGSQGDYYGIIRHSASFGIPAVLVEHCHMDADLSFVDSEEDLVNFGIQDAIAIAQYLGLAGR